MSERLLGLNNGLAIYKVDVSEVREQDKNARVMDKNRFFRLVENIKKEQRLESLPFCVKNPKRENEFLIISGHHRIRAFREAGFSSLFILVDEKTLRYSPSLYSR